MLRLSLCWVASFGSIASGLEVWTVKYDSGDDFLRNQVMLERTRSSSSELTAAEVQVAENWRPAMDRRAMVRQEQLSLFKNLIGILLAHDSMRKPLLPLSSNRAVEGASQWNDWRS